MKVVTIKTAIISTAHVREEDMRLIEEKCRNVNYGWWIHDTDGGAILRIDATQGSGLDDLKSDGLTDFGYANLKAIYDAGYGYIHLDMDAPVIEELPYEEW
ncbi:hypothetical protein OGW13_11525 [Citrobacter sp. Ca225]|jgi:hypothetical protein|uniref:DUF5983 family protein n=1 Tax=Citrobacter sp. Ca225 TaxID=2985002 RepID=UPI0025803B6B|nr:hypothetical protein [Citrobacter sp. Ca225]MDM3520562.1 hypothetical protein [Citrobacter sp. Ca225]